MATELRLVCSPAGLCPFHDEGGAATVRCPGRCHKESCEEAARVEIRGRGWCKAHAIEVIEHMPGPLSITFDPPDLEAAANRVEKLRVGFLLDIDNDGGADVVAEQHVLLALSALEQAARYLKIASYTQARTNADRTRGTR